MSRSQRDEEHLAGDGISISNGTSYAALADAQGASALAPSGVTVSTVDSWLKVNVQGVTKYIPCWS